MAPTAALPATQSHVPPGGTASQRRLTQKQRPAPSRIHNRSQSSTKLTTSALALTQARPDSPAAEGDHRAKRKIKSVEDITLLRPNNSAFMLSRPRPTSCLSNKRPVLRESAVEENVKVAGGGDEEEWMSESGASSPTQGPDEPEVANEEEEEYDGPEIRIGPHAAIAAPTKQIEELSMEQHRSRTPTLQHNVHEAPGLTIQTEFPSLPSAGPTTNMAIYRAPRSPHTPGRLRPMSLIRPPSFASAVVTAPPILDNHAVLSGPDSPASDMLPDSPMPGSSAPGRAPSIAPSASSVVPSRVRTISAMSGASGAASRAMDALSRANANPFLTSHFPHLPPQDQVHHLLPNKFVAAHMSVKRYWTPVDDAVARIRPALRTVVA